MMGDHATLRANVVLRTHLPGRDWRWLGRRRRCRHCGQRFPCPPRLTALDHLAARAGQPAEPPEPPRWHERRMLLWAELGCLGAVVLLAAVLVALLLGS